MSAQELYPKNSPLPPPPSTDPLTKDQWRTLLAFADTVVPCIRPEADARKGIDVALPANDYAMTLNKIERYTAASSNSDLAREYLSEKPSENPVFRDSLYRLLALNVPSDLKQQLVLGLVLLDYRVSAVFLTGHISRFADLPIEAREQVIWSWSHNLIPIVRMLFKSLTLMVKQTWAKCSLLLHQVIGYPRVPIHGVPAKGFEFSFIQIPSGNAPEIIETDVVIVGSGCGAGVVAKNLSEAGHRVLVVDKSYYWPAEHLPMKETEGWAHQFVNGGFLFSEDSSACVIAGQTWGGGGSINWSASLQTQAFVREEWAKGGLPFFTSSEYQECLDKVCDRMSVSTKYIRHNRNNEILLKGSHKLGFTAKEVPQNSGGKEHYCGYCHMGCNSTEKQGPVVTFLPDAAKAGANFIEGLDVHKVKFRTSKKTGKKEACGIIGTWTSRDTQGGVSGQRYNRRVQINAKKVVISAGTMNSPLVLMRSGLKNRHIGKNLKLHPTICLGGIYDEEINPWEGGILTSVVSNFENLDGQGHGTKLECCTMLPSTWLAFPVWHGGVDWKTLAPQFKNMSGHIALCRDTTKGSVYLDPVDGRSRFRYNPVAKDRRHIMEGLIALAKLNYISGARELFTVIPGVPRFVRDSNTMNDSPDAGINDKKFNEWLNKLRKAGLRDPDTTVMSAHQMGTCRMAPTPAKGAVDPTGKTWEADSLYVADASTFPSASGVNPMITNMAISEYIARNVDKDLKSMSSKSKI